ncbi:P-loop containing nucleoside triphosphate hydrolase protein [Zychaea mexicana]|uniref:P-loop containing nucleoside triphosphate hydrolase protein n=1 Tax=Zychaea mexicana TaxID=64656 RepID=UPI0022FDFE6E|nr:P-loop containing nucleoside triphosphate hydrolase protein [Zychaea mexicana]KAI9497703.1 P-loop containing nucleoside triphosphate hydrolase protein [Zychaea mexicana]
MITTASSSPSPSPSPQRSDRIGGTFIHSHGTKVFVPDRLDNVQDAVNQARFSEKRWVWIEDEQHGYVRAQVIREFEKSPRSARHPKIEVEHESGQTCFVPADKVYSMNPPKFDRVEDMAELTHLNEPSVIHNLTLRYHTGETYTYSGLFLVAVNPYRKLPIYSQDYIQSYKGRRRGELPPHIYAVADQAYHDMVQDGDDQSILITGESGAGKTENTKIVIQYLAAVANTAVRSEIEQQILQANPILEAFGNAQTIRNNNSSRFGKFIRIKFNNRAQICGANIEWYLLEKSRVHQQTPEERNYHVFYQLLSADDSFKEQLLLGGQTAKDYNFTKNSSITIDGVDDAEDYQKLLKSLDIMGLSDKEKFDLFRIVAAVLHLGNIIVTPDFRERADIRDFTSIERLCHLLGIPAQDFKKGLLAPRIKAGSEWVSQAKSLEQVQASLVALAKTLYERNFASLVERVNQALDGQKTVDKTQFIGVLDIAGFEIFEVNSFEQLCINYTNEKLQQFFNHSMFVLEQEEYKKERIDWSYIDFGLDLQPTINLIEKANPIGILSCLEEECVAPRGTDKRFLEKLNKVWNTGEGDAKYKPRRFDEGFIVTHYAGRVEYSTKGWIDKNKDPLNEDVTRLLARSTQPYVARLFEDYLTDNEKSTDMTLTKLRKGTGSFRTVGQRHKQQLLALMCTLESTHPRFIRCILPNDRKRAGQIQTKLVLGQLRCNGVLEGIRICRKGFPNRLSFDDFRKRYEILCPNQLPTNCFIYGRSACQTLLDAMQLDPERYRIGTTKVFFKATVLAELEEIRDRHLANYMTGFQAMCRRYIARQKMTRKARQTEAIRVMQRNARIYVTLREWPWWKVYAKLRSAGVAYRGEAQIKERDQKIAQQETQITEQTSEIQELTQKCQQLTSQQDDYAGLVQSQQAIVRELEESKQALVEKVAGHEEEMEEAQKQAEAQANMIARLHRDIRECSEENEQLATRYEAVHGTNETLTARVEYLENENGRLSKERENNVDSLRKELEELKKSNEAQISALKNERDEYKQKLSDAEENHRAEQNLFTQRQTELEEKLKLLNDELQQKSKERTDYENKHDILQSNWQDLARLVQSEAAEAQARSER